MYVEIHEGSMQCWKNVDAARKDNNPDFRMRLRRATVRWDKNQQCFGISLPDEEPFEFEGTVGELLYVRVNASLMWMMSMAFRAQAKWFDDPDGCNFNPLEEGLLEHVHELSQLMELDGISTTSCVELDDSP